MLITHHLNFVVPVIFVLAYILVIAEDYLKLRKSKPMLMAASIIWIAIAYFSHKDITKFNHAIEHYLLEYAQLLLFLIVAMTYINVLEERLVFARLKNYLISLKLSYRQMFWLTGVVAFFTSSIADNLTTALIMGAIVLEIGKENKKFASVSCINIVIAANAGGAFSPFGDITTLMVWQKDILPFFTFFKIFIPSLINFLIPACCLQFAISKTTPKVDYLPITKVKPGGYTVIALFLLTIFTTVILQLKLKLPPCIGMMLGLGYLNLYTYYLERRYKKPTIAVFSEIQRLEWDTLLFFYGAIMSVGGLATLGYLSILSNQLYTLGPTMANIMVGFISAIVDNIPVMFAILTMQPTMNESQWLLITLTAGVGGSLLSIGSAAGVALMGQTKEYNFFSHLRWSWAIMLGFLASIASHLLINGY